MDNTNKFKKEVQNETLYIKNFYLIVFSELKNGLRPAQICSKYSKSKSALQYDLNKLKKAGIIRKLGYGTWEIIGEPIEKEVKKLVKKTKTNTSDDLKSFFDKSNSGIKRYKQYLDENNLLKCIFCGRLDINIHHLRPKLIVEDDSFDNLIPVCVDHHKLIHAGGLTKNMNDIINNFKESLLNVKIKNKIRGHAFVFTLKVPRIMNWSKREEYLKKKKIDYVISNTGQRIIIDGYKVFLYNKKIVIFFPKGASILENSASESKKKAFQDAFEVVYKLEKIMNVSLRMNKFYQIKLVKQHYAELKNELANDYNSKNQKLKIADENGIWLIIDDSHHIKLDEMETIDSKKSDVDMDDVVKPFFNSLRKSPFTAYDFKNLSEIVSKSTELVGKFAEQQGAYAGEIAVHREAIKELRDGVVQMTSVLSKIENYLKVNYRK